MRRRKKTQTARERGVHRQARAALEGIEVKPAFVYTEADRLKRTRLTVTRLTDPNPPTRRSTTMTNRKCYACDAPAIGVAGTNTIKGDRPALAACRRHAERITTLETVEDVDAFITDREHVEQLIEDNWDSSTNEVAATLAADLREAGALVADTAVAAWITHTERPRAIRRTIAAMHAQLEDLAELDDQIEAVATLLDTLTAHLNTEAK